MRCFEWGAEFPPNSNKLCTDYIIKQIAMSHLNAEWQSNWSLKGDLGLMLPLRDITGWMGCHKIQWMQPRHPSHPHLWLLRDWIQAGLPRKPICLVTGIVIIVTPTQDPLWVVLSLSYTEENLRGHLYLFSSEHLLLLLFSVLSDFFYPQECLQSQSAGYKSLVHLHVFIHLGVLCDQKKFTQLNANWAASPSHK